MSNWSLARTSLCAGAVVAAVEAVLLVAGNGAVLSGILLDPDCYMHLQRALRMMAEGHWHETIDPRINAPYGFAIHWTYLFDTLLAIGAAPLSWLGLDRHAALLVWGSAISPVLLIAALAVFAWGTRRQVSGALFVWMTILILTQPQLAGSFIAGRSDHHSLVLGLLFAQLAWAYALFDGRAGWRAAVVAGVLAGIQLATSVEALLTILLLSAGITAAWILYGRRHMTELALYLGGCVVTAVAWLLWERGQYLFTPAYDRISIVHVVVLGAGLIGCAGIAITDQRDRLNTNARRIGAVAAAAVFALVATAASFPAFFLGPWAHLDPVIVAWHKQIGELHPLAPTDLKSLGGFFAQMTAPILALPLVINRLRRGPDQDKPIMLLTLTGFVLFGSLGMVQMRWSGEVQAIMILPWTLTTVAIMKSTIGFRLGKTHIPLRAFALSAALLLQLVPSVMAQGNVSFTTHPASVCRWSDAALVLSRSVPAGQSIVMAPVWYGPEILWRSDLRVIAGPYEMLPALKDTQTFFDGSEVAARAIVERRRVAYALVCTQDGGSGFGGRLSAGKAPRWLQPVPLLNGPGEIRLYKVVR